MRIHKKDRTPKYIQIYDWVQAMIRKGRFKLGDKIPTEPELAARFSVSRMTVRKGIDPLVLEGVLERQRGLGTYVISADAAKITYNAARPIRFFHAMEQLGIPHRFELVKKEKLEAGPAIQKYLNLGKDHRVIRLTMVLFAEEIPVIIARDYYPYHEFRRLLDQKLEVPPFQFLADEMNIQVKTVDQYISAVVAGEEEMKLFGIDDPVPCLYLEWISSGEDGLPFNVVLCHYRGDAYKFKIPASELVRSDVI